MTSSFVSKSHDSKKCLVALLSRSSSHQTQCHCRYPLHLLSSGHRERPGCQAYNTRPGHYWKLNHPSLLGAEHVQRQPVDHELGNVSCALRSREPGGPIEAKLLCFHWKGSPKSLSLLAEPGAGGTGVHVEANASRCWYAIEKRRIVSLSTSSVGWVVEISEKVRKGCGRRPRPSRGLSESRNNGKCLLRRELERRKMEQGSKMAWLVACL